MRFSAPRTESPPPQRRQKRPPAARRSTFGVPPDSSDESSDSEAESTASSSSDSFVYASGSDEPKPLVASTTKQNPFRPAPEMSLSLSTSRTQRAPRSISEQHNIEDMLASIRLRVTHHDVYEEWEQQTRKDAFVSARHEQAAVKEDRRHSLATSQTRFSSTQSAMHQRQQQEVEARLAQLRNAQQQQETMLRAAWKERNGELWKRVENVIKIEEDKVKAKLEAERKRQEEAERQRREIEERKRQEEERRLQEEERKKQEILKKRKEEKDKEEQKAKEEQERQKQQEQDAAQNSETDKALEQGRKALGVSTSAEDWKRARDILKKLKDGPMKDVKANKAMKAVWNANRRQITQKIGQLTNDVESINKITHEIVNIVQTTPPLPRAIYFALLSSISKAILMQAETEVTAEKRSAIPLAQVAANLLATLDRFSNIFWAKLCQRAGGWPVPAVIPAKDIDGTPFDEASRTKALGYRKDETHAEFMTRISGLMRVYFHILTASVPKPVDPRYRLPRYWTYFARIVGEPQLLSTDVAAEIIYIALDVHGSAAVPLWGNQWMKVLELLYEGATTGVNGNLIGGSSAEGIAARVRVQLEIERIVSTI